MRSRAKSKRIKMPKYDTGKRTIDQMLKDPAQMQGSYAAVGNPGGYTWDYPEANDGPVITPYGNYQDRGEYNRWHDLSAYDPNAPFEMFNQFVFGAPFALYDTADQAIKGTYGTPKAETPAQNLMGNIAMAMSPSRWAETARQGAYNQRWVAPWSEENAGIMQDPNLSNTFDLLLLHGLGNSNRLANAKEAVKTKAGRVANGVKQVALNTVGDALQRYLIWRDLKNPRRLGFNSTEPAWEWADAKDITNGEKPSLKTRVQDAVNAGVDYAKQKVGNAVNKVRTPLANAYPGLFDPYTTFKGSLGYYGNSFGSRLYNTVARNFGFKGTPSMPELIRAEKYGFKGEGYGENAGGKTGRFPWINTTTDHIVRDHTKGKWKGSDVVIIDGKAYPAENYLSTTPGDTFILNKGVNIDPSKVTVVSGDTRTLEKAKNAGYETLSSPRAREIYNQNKKTFERAENNSTMLGRFRMDKGSGDSRFDGDKNLYTDELQRLIEKRGIPTEQDYQYQSSQTGLPVSFNTNDGKIHELSDSPGHMNYEVAPPSESRLRKRLGMNTQGQTYNGKQYTPSEIRDNALQQAYEDYGEKLDFTNASPEHTVEIQPGKKQQRLQLQKPTYQLYNGPTHKISEVINEDGTVNLKNLLKIEQEARQYLPGGTSSRHRPENPKYHKTDRNTFMHTRDAYNRALGANYPNEYLFATLMHDAGKLWAGDGHGPYGASIVKQIFPEATADQIAAIYHHMEENPKQMPAKLVKGVDIAEDNDFRPVFPPLGIIDHYNVPAVYNIVTDKYDPDMASYQFYDNPTEYYTVTPIDNLENDLRKPGENVVFEGRSSLDSFAKDDPQFFANLYQLRRKAMADMYSGDTLIGPDGFSADVKNNNPVNKSDYAIFANYENIKPENGWQIAQMLNRYAFDLNFKDYITPGDIDQIREIGRKLYNVKKLDPFVVRWMQGVSKERYDDAVGRLRKPSVFDNISHQGVTRPYEMSRAIRLQDYINTEKPDNITTQSVTLPSDYNNYAAGFRIGDIQTSNDVINFAKNMLPENWKFEVPKSIPVLGTEKRTLGGHYSSITGSSYVDLSNNKSFSRDLQSTLLHEAVSHGTDAKVKQDADKYDVSKYNDNQGNIGEEHWYETRSTAKEALFSLCKTLKTFDKDKLRKHVDNMSDKDVINLYSSVNGYGQHYERWYNNLSVKEKSEFVDRLRKIMFLPSVVGLLYNNSQDKD